MKPMSETAQREAEACTAESDLGGTPFPQIVARLMAAGVERYHADLNRDEKIYYDPHGGSHAVRCHPVEAEFAQAFSEDGVRAAVKETQAGRLPYPQFCRNIAAAGCVAYLVSFPGRRAVYYGRTGETCVELFPGAA